MFDDDWQIAIGNYCGRILHHLPLHALLIQKLKKGEFKYSFPPSDFTTCSLCNTLNADSSGTIKCKAVGRVERPPLQTIKRSQPNINWWSRRCLHFFHRTQIHQIGSRTG